RLWGMLGGVFLVWALGPYLTVFGANTGLLLPQALARWVPVLNNARMPGRAMLIVAMAAAVLASLTLSRPAARAKTWLLVAALVGVLESVAAPLPMVALPASQAQMTLAGLAAPGAVLPIPFGVRD